MRGRPGPGLLARVLVGKYCDHLPLYRSSEIYARDKVDLHRSTLTDWVGRSTALLAPLAAHIGKLVRAGPALFADDTPVKMQAKGKAQTARLWSYVREEQLAFHHARHLGIVSRQGGGCFLQWPEQHLAVECRWGGRRPRWCSSSRMRCSI